MTGKGTDIVFSWSSTMKMLGLIAGLIFLAVVLYVAEFTILAYVAGAIGLLMLIVLPFMGLGGKALCPVCGAEVELLITNARYVQCGKCGEYLEGRDKKLWQMDTLHIADSPQFAVRLPWDDLKQATSTVIHGDMESYLTEKILTKKGPHRVLPASWPSSCCVCGKPATRQEVIAKTLIKAGGFGRGSMRDEEITIIAERVPHCAEHSQGVCFGTLPGEGWHLKFRSYAYRNEFRRMNSWARP